MNQVLDRKEAIPLNYSGLLNHEAVAILLPALEEPRHWHGLLRANRFPSSFFTKGSIL